MLRLLIIALLVLVPIGWAAPSFAQSATPIVTSSCGSQSLTATRNANPYETTGGQLCTSPSGAAGGGLSTFSKQVANNTTSVAVDASPGTLYALRVYNISATIAYLKLYNAAQGSTTCGSGTPILREMIPANTSGAGGIINIGGGLGVAFSTAITACVTTGFADNDTSAPAATTYIYEADYK